MSWRSKAHPGAPDAMSRDSVGVAGFRLARFRESTMRLYCMLDRISRDYPCFCEPAALALTSSGVAADPDRLAPVGLARLASPVGPRRGEAPRGKAPQKQGSAFITRGRSAPRWSRR